MEYLGEDSEKSFPYLQRNAQWVGILRRLWPALTDSHERELFDYLYGSKKAIGLKKDTFFNLVEKKANRLIGVNPNEPLNLHNVASTSSVTAGAKESIAKVQAEIEELTSERVKLETNIARAKNEGNEKLEARFRETRSLTNAAILRKIELKDMLERQMRELERNTHFDLFSQSPAAPLPKPAAVPAPAPALSPTPKPAPKPEPQKQAKAAANPVKPELITLAQKVRAQLMQMSMAVPA